MKGKMIKLTEKEMIGVFKEILKDYKLIPKNCIKDLNESIREIDKTYDKLEEIIKILKKKLKK